MSQVKVKENESLESALRRFKSVGVRVAHTVERLRLYGGAGACQSYL